MTWVVLDVFVRMKIPKSAAKLCQDTTLTRVLQAKEIEYDNVQMDVNPVMTLTHIADAIRASTLTQLLKTANLVRTISVPNVPRLEIVNVVHAAFKLMLPLKSAKLKSLASLA